MVTDHKGMAEGPAIEMQSKYGMDNLIMCLLIIGISVNVGLIF